MQVEHGVRFELSRVLQSEDSATYRLVVETPERAWQGEARIESARGDVRLTFEEPSSPPPSWCETIVRAALRTLYRERSAGKPFPVRVTRWRPAPAPEQS
jgi:hypothetical protein